MAIHFVEFSDQDQSSIRTVFASAQDAEIYQCQGEVGDDDPRYMAFVDSMTPSKLELNKAGRDRLLQIATLSIAPLQDAVDLDDATVSETALLKAWKQYRVAVNRIDLTGDIAEWPVQPA
ncbi:tail fiber assembly protein [Pseudomonas petrae]|uniref:Tail fiber assembly protein n=1 Tax=Pseudomonas petrae TaxID=2912190 RepID=A0ABS9IB89_9PSED|nr:tail fiber assembly protein [Pseudomonas petrae]MCF7544353.1 tail fiber assembly protein [Pseudomonas petrae]